MIRSKTRHLTPPKIFFISTQSYNFDEPKIITKGITSPLWYKSMVEEYNSLVKNKTWKLVPMTKEMNIVGDK